jgi:hypothetical protein
MIQNVIQVRSCEGRVQQKAVAQGEDDLFSLQSFSDIQTELAQSVPKSRLAALIP